LQLCIESFSADRIEETTVGVNYIAIILALLQCKIEKQEEERILERDYRRAEWAPAQGPPQTASFHSYEL